MSSLSALLQIGHGGDSNKSSAWSSIQAVGSKSATCFLSWTGKVSSSLPAECVSNLIELRVGLSENQGGLTSDFIEDIDQMKSLAADWTTICLFNPVFQAKCMQNMTTFTDSRNFFVVVVFVVVTGVWVCGGQKPIDFRRDSAQRLQADDALISHVKLWRIISHAGVRVPEYVGVKKS